MKGEMGMETPKKQMDLFLYNATLETFQRFVEIL